MTDRSAGGTPVNALVTAAFKPAVTPGGRLERKVTASWDPETKTWTKDVTVERQPPAPAE